MATKQRRKKTKQPKNQRSLRRLWVHDSRNFFVLRINNGTEAFDYFVSYFGHGLYRLIKLVVGKSDETVYWTNINCTSSGYGCQCDSFKHNASSRTDGDDTPPTCKHIDALLKDQSV